MKKIFLSLTILSSLMMADTIDVFNTENQTQQQLRDGSGMGQQKKMQGQYSEGLTNQEYGQKTQKRLKDGSGIGQKHQYKGSRGGKGGGRH